MGSQAKTNSPESPPAAVRVGGRGRLTPVLRLALAGAVVVAVLGPVDLTGWVESRPWLAQSSSVQTAIEDLDQGLAAIGFHVAYDWLRRQTRAVQALRFNAEPTIGSSGAPGVGVNGAANQHASRPHLGILPA